MNIGWWLQFLGLIATALGAVSLLIGFLISPNENIIRSIKNYVGQQIHYGIGDNVAGDKIIINQRPRFSEIKYIKTLPPSLGGIDRFVVDNLATLKLHVPYDEQNITLLLNVVPLEYPTQQNKNIKIEGAQTTTYNDDQILKFNKTNHRVNKITIENRTFVISLNKITILQIPNISKVLQYEFGISEE